MPVRALVLYSVYLTCKNEAMKSKKSSVNLRHRKLMGEPEIKTLVALVRSRVDVVLFLLWRHDVPFGIAASGARSVLFLDNEVQDDTYLLAVT